MYKNKCTKCGAEFETKNPKRVICPGCLYPDRKDLALDSYKQSSEEAKPAQDKDVKQKSPGYYVMKESSEQTRRPTAPFKPSPRPGGGYNQQRPGGSGGFRRPQQHGGYNQQRPSSGGFRRPPQQGGQRPYQRDNRGGPSRRPAPANKKLLISREQVAEIENLYKEMLPLPNPDCHEVIGEKMELEANKVFFGINLVRQKMLLPKLPYPKRKLAISPDQLTAIKNLYTPLLPLPPIGCHKFLAKQLKMDEWRVHVGIGIIRKQMNLPRWNTEREDAPAEFKNQNQKQEKETKKKKSTKEPKEPKEPKETKEKKK